MHTFNPQGYSYYWNPRDNRVGVRGEAERIWLSTYRVPRQEHSRTRMLLEMSSVTDEPPPAVIPSLA